MVYTAVIVAANELSQDDVLAVLQRAGIVTFFGPGALVQDDGEPVCEACGGVVDSNAPVISDGRALCERCAASDV